MQHHAGMVIGSMTWRAVAFAHWAVDPAAVRSHVPEQLELDTYGGSAFVGLVGLRIEDARMRFLPPLPLLRRWPQVNLRTYVTCRGVRGIHLFSMDTSRTLPMVGSRALVGAPYHRGRVRVEQGGGVWRYRVSRRWPGPRPAELDASCRVGRTLGEAQSGSLEEFLVERYSAFTVRGGVVIDTPVRHRPYFLCMATIDLHSETLREAAGLQGGQRIPDLYCRELQVQALAPRLAAGRVALSRGTGAEVVAAGSGA